MTKWVNIDDHEADVISLSMSIGLESVDSDHTWVELLSYQRRGSARSAHAIAFYVDKQRELPLTVSVNTGFLPQWTWMDA